MECSSGTGEGADRNRRKGTLSRLSPSAGLSTARKDHVLAQLLHPQTAFLGHLSEFLQPAVVSTIVRGRDSNRLFKISALMLLAAVLS